MRTAPTPKNKTDFCIQHRSCAGTSATVLIRLWSPTCLGHTSNGLGREGAPWRVCRRCCLSYEHIMSWRHTSPSQSANRVVSMMLMLLPAALFVHRCDVNCSIITSAHAPFYLMFTHTCLVTHTISGGCSRRHTSSRSPVAISRHQPCSSSSYP
jgi:hypothetical protein